MNRKMFFLLIVSVFLIASIGFISAQDNANDADLADDVIDDVVSDLKDIHVQKIWQDDGFEDKRPDSAKVELYVDGNLVDTVYLNESNDWQADFKDVDVSGSIKVVEVGSSPDYKLSYSGDAENGFNITATIIPAAGSDVLGDNGTDEDANQDNENSNESDNGTDEDTTSDIEAAGGEDNSTDSDNQTDDENNNASDNNDVQDIQKTEPLQKPKPTPPPKNPEPIDLKNTGIPLAILVIIAVIIVFVPFKRGKQ